jgi:hypothetical protein
MWSVALNRPSMNPEHVMMNFIWPGLPCIFDSGLALSWAIGDNPIDAVLEKVGGRGEKNL